MALGLLAACFGCPRPELATEAAELADATTGAMPARGAV